MRTTPNSGADRNAVGAHGGAYSIYRALAISAGAMAAETRPELHNTYPAASIGPHAQWHEPGKIVSLDPWGHRVAEDFASELAEGVDIRPTIAITKARIDLPEIREAIAKGRLKVDGQLIHEAGDVAVTHHLPHPNSTPAMFAASPLNRFFVAGDATELLAGAGARLWLHGHTHSPRDYVVGTTRVLCNPRGYPHERRKPPVDLGLAVELDVAVDRASPATY